jgi:hypothetical protein
MQGITYAQAQVATGTAEAYGTDAKVAPHGQPIATTGAAGDVTAIKYPVKYAYAGHASGTGAAQGDDASIAATSTVATGVGAALPASFSLRANGGIATATGAVLAGSTSIGPNALPASGTGTGRGPVTAIATSLGVAQATGTAETPLWSDEDHILAFTGIATGTGTARSVLRGRTWGTPPIISPVHPRPSSRTHRLVPVGTAAHLKPEH